MFKTVGSISRLDLHVHVARTKLEENISGFFIFIFVLEIRPILFPHTLLWGVLATPNQHQLTLPSSPEGKSPDLHAEVQQFKPHSGNKFFFLRTYYPVATHIPISDNFSTYLEKKKVFK